MNICLFFEGTGHGVAGKVTNVTRLRDICASDARQRLHLEAGPGTRFGSYLRGTIAGSDWRAVFRDARRWFEAGAKREGLRIRRAVRLSQKLDASAVVLHDPHGESSNLWGAFDRVRRNLPRIRLHFACKGL